MERDSPASHLGKNCFEMHWFHSLVAFFTKEKEIWADTEEDQAEDRVPYFRVMKTHKADTCKLMMKMGEKSHLAKWDQALRMSGCQRRKCQAAAGVMERVLQRALDGRVEGEDDEDEEMW